jgi:hypothetical protein
LTHLFTKAINDSLFTPQISLFTQKNFGMRFPKFFSMYFNSPFQNFPLFLGVGNFFSLKKTSENVSRNFLSEKRNLKGEKRNFQNDIHMV